MKRSHYHNKSLIICTQAQANPPPPRKNSLWSVVTPVTPARASLSSRAADLRTPHQQIGLGERIRPDKGGSLPLLLYLKSITPAFTFSISPQLSTLLFLSAVTVGLGQLPNRVPSCWIPPPPTHHWASVFDNAFMLEKGWESEAVVRGIPQKWCLRVVVFGCKPLGLGTFRKALNDSKRFGGFYPTVTKLDS